MSSTAESRVASALERREQTRPVVGRLRWFAAAAWLVMGLTILVVTMLGSPAAAQGQPAPVESPGGVNIDPPLQVPALSDEDVPDLSVSLQDGASDTAAASQSLTVILLLTVLSLAPTLLILVTSFTRIIIVLGITRNALSLQGIPPNQVLIGLALFLSLFVMAPVLTEINDEALQPLLDEEISQTEAFERGMEPLRVFMLEQVRDEDLATFVNMTDAEPATPDDVALTTLIPAFVMSELRAGFIIGFLVFIPFLIIDIVVSATLMSMGMVMLPPVVISLPFKLLLFVIVDGWALLVPTLVTSFST
ncbi:MAG: flagellar type III secretion system pore protein FliP [Acidimicrobiales bacterium]